MDDQELQTLVEATRRDAARLGVLGVHNADQIDAFLRDHWHHVLRIALGQEDARKELGDALFDAISRAMAMKLTMDAFAVSIDRLKDELADLADQA